MPRKPNTAKDHYHDPFPCALRELVKARNLTQEQLTAVLGVKSRQSITGYLDGSTAPTAEKIVAVSKFFGVSADYLLGLTDDTYMKPDQKAAALYLNLPDRATRCLAQLTHTGKRGTLLSELLQKKVLEKIVLLIERTSCEIGCLRKRVDEGNAVTASYELRHIQRDLAEDLEKALREMTGYNSLNYKLSEISENQRQMNEYENYEYMLSELGLMEGDDHGEHQED